MRLVAWSIKPRTRRAIRKWGAWLSVALIAVNAASFAFVVAYCPNSGPLMMYRCAHLEIRGNLPAILIDPGLKFVQSVSFYKVPAPWDSLLWPSWKTGPLGPAKVWVLNLPAWPLVALIVLPTIWAWRAEARARRVEAGPTCSSCGYSRAGLDPAAACPECGQKLPRA